MDYLSPWAIFSVSWMIAFTGNFLSSQAQSYEEFIIVGMIGMGIGLGIMNLVPLVIAWEYWPDKKLITTGILMSAFVIGPIFNELNPIMIENKDG